MKNSNRLVTWIFIIAANLGVWHVPCLWADETGKEKQETWNFDGVVLGQLSEDWKIEGTNQKGPLATWQVIADESAPSGGRALALSRTNHDSAGTFNICWTDVVYFLNGEINVWIKANAGKEDQGGGVIWRVRDKNNYYIARFNPLEENFRVYYVKDGERKMLVTARVNLPAGVWHKMKIEHHGDKIEGYLNGSRMLEVTDHTLTKPGGIGLWTKADAVSSFDDLAVSPQ